VATRKLTRSQACSALGDMPERSFARLVSEGLPRGGKGHAVWFPWPEIWHWYVDRERKSARDAVKVPDMGLAESERTEAQAKAEIAKMKAEEMRGDLIPADLHQSRLNAFVGGMMSVVDGRLNRFERDIVAAGTPAEARKVVDAIKRSVKQGGLELADRIEAEPEEVEAA